jgi:hypothetical protein
MAASTGNGAKVAAQVGGHGTAVNSSCYQSKGNRSMPKTKDAISKDEAAQILQSAVSYCQRAGVAVQGYNEGGTLYLSFDGLMLVRLADTMEFVPLHSERVP